MESKKDAQERVFLNYAKTYNAIPDFSSFKKSLTKTEDEKLFTESTFKSYFLKKCNPELVKAYKNDELKKGDIVLSTLLITGKLLKAQQYGSPKSELTTIVDFGNAKSIIPNKILVDKSTGLVLLKDFLVDYGLIKRHFFASNQFGCHFRLSEAYLKKFVETAAQRKKVDLKNC